MNHTQVANLVEYALRVAGVQARVTGGEIYRSTIVTRLDVIPTDAEMMQAAHDIAQVLEVRVTAMADDDGHGLFSIEIGTR